MNKHDYDYIVIGSGFGGSVSALRLAEKGYRVCVIERGKRCTNNDFAKSNWQLRKWLWAPKLFCTGIQSLTLLKNVLVLSGSGVGGGSLGYCAVLLKPPAPFFNDPQWAGLQDDWQKVLAPFYDIATKMLGVTQNPKLWKGDELLREYAQDLQRENYFNPTNVGIFFGDSEHESDDPFFNGNGPARTGCDHKGSCMVGCRTGGKNSLDLNYLYLAEKLGVTIMPETLVTNVAELSDAEYEITTEESTRLFNKKRMKLTASGVVFAAGTLGTNKLLLSCKQRGSLPRLSDRLGKTVRTNSEVLVGAKAKDKKYNFSEGISITSSLFVDEHTHIEPVRYPQGSDAMFWLSTLLTDGGSWLSRPLKFLWNCLKHPLEFLRTLFPFGWAKNSIILLVMQDLDNRMDLFLKQKWYRPFANKLASRRNSSTVPNFIPQANEAAKAIAKKINGAPQSALTEVLFNAPVTAHIIGGCVIGKDRESGVIDKNCRVFGYENMLIVDGSTIPANLGVNPSLTITAIAEYAMSSIHPKEI
ncbi:MAG: GMC family oxidoreductase [Calditrichaeota bacterium]|nr:GMC family oxidoreductase [Calditrichota bacterium]